VKPAISVSQAFSAEYRIACAGVSPAFDARPSFPKCDPMWTCVSIRPGRRVRAGKS
jgi:hypothetical protein